MKPKITIYIVAFISILLLLNGPSSYAQKTKMTSAHTTDLSNEILQQNRQMENAFQTNDFLKVASFYADSSKMIGEKHIIEGRQDIDAYWSKMKGRGVSWELENLYLEICDNLAVQQGISRLKYIHNNIEQLSVVRFTLVWKRLNGVWLIELDHYSLL